MMTFEDRFKFLLARLVEESSTDTGVTVKSYNEDTVGAGYCDTCYYERTVIEIFYEVEGKRKKYVYDGDFAGLMGTLNRIDKELSAEEDED